MSPRVWTPRASRREAPRLSQARLRRHAGGLIVSWSLPPSACRPSSPASPAFLSRRGARPVADRRKHAIGGAQDRRQAQIHEVDARNAERDVAVGHHSLVQQRIDQIEHGRLAGLEHVSRSGDVRVRFARTWHRQSCTNVYGGQGPLIANAYPCFASVRASRAASVLNAAARAFGTRNAASSRSGPPVTGSWLAARRLASFDRASSRSYNPATTSPARDANSAARSRCAFLRVR